MCGILGEFAFNNKLIEKHQFLSLLELSNLRGPDFQGYYSNNNIQFGFNRLSILDLSKNANQPINSPSKRFTMIFNGEIYNHLELRTELPKNKYNFIGNGDTETLIKYFDYFGVYETVNRLDGMYAIAIFDNFENYLYLIRDFAGIKPLHYGIQDGLIIFASQYNQITMHPQFNNNDFDQSILHLYLEQHFIPAPFGILNNTYQVKPGEIIVFNNKGQKVSKIYWEFSNPKSFLINNRDDAIEFMNIEISNAVKDELSSDVPIGAFLSGGVDSPIICSTANNNLNNNLKTFTIGSDSLLYDESKDALEFANYISVVQ